MFRGKKEALSDKAETKVQQHQQNKPKKEKEKEDNKAYLLWRDILADRSHCCSSSSSFVLHLLGNREDKIMTIVIAKQYMRMNNRIAVFRTRV